MPINTVEVEEFDWHKGVAYPRGVRFRDIIITGPPSSGKSSLVQKLGGWGWLQARQSAPSSRCVAQA